MSGAFSGFDGYDPVKEGAEKLEALLATYHDNPGKIGPEINHFYRGSSSAVFGVLSGSLQKKLVEIFREERNQKPCEFVLAETNHWINEIKAKYYSENLYQALEGSSSDLKFHKDYIYDGDRDEQEEDHRLLKATFNH